ncbi:MAG: Calx-beta domain-containing protein, partial [Crocosphaera sp.]|nr:Calx-beta domain-containing protein [Crocosphaera sp.]
MNRKPVKRRSHGVKKMNTSEIFNLNAISDDYLFIITQTEFLVRDWLQTFADSSDFFSQMGEIFGEVNVTDLQQKWSIGEVDFPEVKVVSSEEINGANGAYAAALNTIYFSDVFLQDNADNLDKIVGVFLEEYGHYLDAQLNVVDTMGDEGEKFSAIVRGVELSTVELARIDLENDRNIVTLEGQTVEIEKNIDDKSLSFDGIDDYVEIPHDESLSLTTFTVEAWVNPSQIKNQWQAIIAKLANNGWEINYGLWIPPNEMRIGFGFIENNSSIEHGFYSQKSLILNEWNHISVTYDGASLKLYLNGELDESVDLVAVPYQNNYVVKIAKGRAGASDGLFAGQIDEVRIWNIARTAEEIQANYAQELTGNETGLVGYWQFNEGTGTTATDLSSNNNNGNILGDATFTSGVFSPGTFVFTQSNFSVTETGHPLTEVTINRLDGLGGDASVTVNLADGSATATDDYDSTPIVVNFANGETSKTVTIPIVKDDIADSSETINLSLINPTNGATIGEQDTASLMIFEDAALSFDGVDDYINMGVQPSLEVDDFLTMEAWVNPITKNSVGMIINKEGEYEVWRQSNGEIRLGFGNSSSGWTIVETGYFMPENEWTHIAVTYENGLIKTYANGSLVHTYNGSGSIGDRWPSNNEFQIGSRELSNVQHFTGKIDEVRIWNIARTAEEIQANYAQKLTGTEIGLVGYWQFKEGTGDTTVDLSENGNDGTIIGASWSEGFFGNSVLGFSQPEFTVKEDGSSSVAVSVVRTGGFNETVKATVNLTDVTTTTDDYLQSSVEVTLAPGEASKTVIIPVDDFLVEGDEIVNLTLTNPIGNATIGEQNTATLTITDNDFDWYDPNAWESGVVPADGSNVTLNYPGEQVKVTFSNGNPSLNTFSLYAIDQSVLSPELTAYTTVANATLEARGFGSQLDLSNLNTLTGATNGSSFSNHWLNLYANEGGNLNLSNLTEITGGATRIVA